MAARWRIELLGGLRATSADRVVNRFRTQKTGVLLGCLAYDLQRAHPRDVLIDMLWPDCASDAGRHRLSVAVSSLRSQLEPPGIPAGTVIAADRATVQLNPVAVSTDVAEFEAALQSAERAGSTLARGPWLAQAVELYRGPLLRGYYENWILAEQERLAERHFQALRRLVADLESAGDLERALQVARRGISADPLREEAHAEVMRLLVAAGQPAAALRQYRELERLLEQELDATPSAATCALVSSLRLQPRAPGSERRAPPPKQAPARGAATVSASNQISKPGARTSLPTGRVTFLLTDIEGSTALWERAGDAYTTALMSHHALLRRTFREHGGSEVKLMGDGFLVAFGCVGDALSCAIAGQRALNSQPWPEPVRSLLVRMALHTGDVELREGDYHGLALHHADRMLLVAHGGQILLSETTAAQVQSDREPGARLADLGVYRLRGVATPERLFQVEYPGMARREFPPLNAEAGYASNLPLPFTRFFGREEELTRLVDLLRAPGTRLVTLMGPGGTGKTRLSLEVAGRLVEAWRGAVWFVPLADLSEAGNILDAVRDALRLPRPPGVEALEQLVLALSRQPTLLLLDNFEQLVTEGASVVRDLLARVPTLTCLVTSRQRLGVAGEREFFVAPLPIPDRADSPVESALIRCESVQLFVNRAQAVRPDFQVTSANAADVATLCRQLEGMPLALELAAARAQVMTPVQMVARLTDRLGFLVSRQRDAAARHRTLRATIDWSYRLLSPELQRFFAGLSVFRGGWTLEAAEAVCDDLLALDHLAELRECSLVETEERGGEIRFRMLETLRQYAGEQLTPEERAALERRHAASYLTLAERAEPELYGPEQARWLERLSIEHDNLRAVLAWSRAEEEAGEMGLRLAAALWWFWFVRGHLSEGRQRLAEFLALPAARGQEPSPGEATPGAAHSEPTIARAMALQGAGAVAHMQGDWATARRQLEESVALWRSLEDRSGLAHALRALGWLVLALGDNAAACAMVQESLAIYRRMESKHGVARSLNFLGQAACVTGEYAAARPLLEESLGLAREARDEYVIGLILNNLGEVARHLGDDEAAHAYFAENLALRRGMYHPLSVAQSLDGMAGLASVQGQPERAARLFGAAACVRDTLGARHRAQVDWQVDYERDLAATRAQLGEAAFASAWAQGRALTLEQAIEEAGITPSG